VDVRGHCRRRAREKGAGRTRQAHHVCEDFGKLPECEWLIEAMIRKLKSGGYRLYSRKKNPKNRKTTEFGYIQDARCGEKHERAVQYFKTTLEVCEWRAKLPVQFLRTRPLVEDDEANVPVHNDRIARAIGWEAFHSKAILKLRCVPPPTDSDCPTIRLERRLGALTADEMKHVHDAIHKRFAIP